MEKANTFFSEHIADESLGMKALT